jgi:hypothetical protein
MMSKYLQDYIQLYRRLAKLPRDANCKQKEEILDHMDAAWKMLTKKEIEEFTKRTRT